MARCLWTSLSPMLCSSCERCWENQDSLVKPITQHSKFRHSVYESSLAACQICSILCCHFNAKAENQPADELNLECTFRTQSSWSQSFYNHIYVKFSWESLDNTHKTKAYELVEEHGGYSYQTYYISKVLTRHRLLERGVWYQQSS